MTTDKTLATAKHGGCVQLGTSERERFEAWAKSRDPDFCIYRDGSYPFEWQGQWEAWQAAQPSPGGQGDVLAIIEEFIQCATLGRPHGKLIAQAKDYLAARQPVDVFVAYETWPDDLKAKLSVHDLRRMNGWSPRTSAGEWRIDTSAGGPILVYKGCSVIEGEDARYILSLIAKDARQPVAEYQYRFWNDEMPGWSSWQPISKSDYERELVEPFEGREVRALYAAPPAQAVDLGPEDRAMLARCLRYCRDVAVDDGSGAEIDRLLALIDNQAVGK